MSAVYDTACTEAARLSFAVGAEHLVLACANRIRERIVDDERSSLATLGISFDDVHAAIGDAGCFPVSPEVKRLLEHAGRNATPERVLATVREHSLAARRLLDEAR